ncbi:uncharacterized protein LOC132950465 [Metopolophium dirhodum]|uniref:uncharacterized protein LOC132950465 n=1 Tax=Metopolophium dirhodum TaxID=44670 RepID=UPI00298F8BED|nr:uncharacterized protein LOC132950465 [Metopolophium dirhodum]
MADNRERRPVVDASTTISEGFEKGCAISAKVVDYVDGFENPVAWQKRYKGRSDQSDVLFDNLDMKSITLSQYSVENVKLPEFIKWKLFGYNIVICYEYIAEGKPNKALEIIGEIENILKCIESNDIFLKSIKIALNHITFSMKGYLLKLCSNETMALEHFIMPNNMNNANKAGLFGIQTLFFYEYGLSCAQIAKDCALKALSLNGTEAEWYFLMAKVLTNWQRTCGNYFECSEQEITASEMAVKLGNKDHHKLHLIHIYHRMSKNMNKNINAKNKILDEALRLLIEVIDNTKDLLLLKNCLLSLSKFSQNKEYNNDITIILDQLIEALEHSDNGYVHGAIGNYYLFNKKDYIKANFHLKKAYDVRSFGSSIDYIFTFFKINPKTAPIEQMMVDLLKSFPHPVHQEKILSQIISYLLLTENDIIRALKYIPMLFSIKNVTSIYSIQTHRTKFSNYTIEVNLLNVISEKLSVALRNTTLSTDDQKRVTEVMKMLESYNLYVSSLMKNKEHIFGNKVTDNTTAGKARTVSYSNDRGRKESWTHNNYKQVVNPVKNKDEGNWRTLKPDSTPKTTIFMRNNSTQIKKPWYGNQDNL